VEKYLKALLCQKRFAYRRTHDLVELIDALKPAGCAIPANVEAAKNLQPYAVQFMYDDVPVGSPAAMDQASVDAHVQAVKAWVQNQIAQASANP